MGAYRRQPEERPAPPAPKECPAQSNYSINMSAVIKWKNGYKKVTSQLDFERQRDFCQAGREDEDIAGAKIYGGMHGSICLFTNTRLVEQNLVWERLV